MQLIKIALVCAFVMIAVPSISGQDLTVGGTVIDNETKKPIPGVTVFVPELNRGVVTDNNGNFNLMALPNRQVTIQVSFMGYNTHIQKINPGIGPIIITLTETASSLDEVVISGAYVMSKESSPISIEKVNRNEILKMPAPSLMSALARTPGISEISLGPGISKPVIRGLSFSRVMSVYQGARFENQQWGADHGLGLTETGIGNIEIIKGPASLIYGSGAMAGVVNLIEEADAAKGEVEGDVVVRGFSNSLGGRSEAGVKGATENGFIWSVRGALESHADYLDGDGNTVGNTRFNTQNLKAGLGLQKSWGTTRFRYTYLKQNLGILEEDEMDELVTTRNDRRMQLPYQDVTDHFFNSETDIFLGKDKLKATFGYHMNFREEIEDDFDEVDLGIKLKNFMYDIKYYKSVTEKTEAIFGVQGFYMRNINYVEAQEFLIPDAIKDDRSIYALLNYTDSKWVLQGGLRYDYRKVDVDASAPHFVDFGFVLPGEPESRQLTRSFGGFTTSGGATFRPDNHWRFRLNVAQGFRAPDLAELFSNGVHPGTSRFERGDANFIREQNIQTDFGIRYKKAGFHISAEAFYNDINNYIFFAPTGEMVGDLDLWTFEQADARLYGGEIEMGYEPQNAKWVNFTTGYAMAIGRRKSDNSHLPFIPAYQWTQSIDFRLNDKGKIKRPYISILGNLVFDQNRPAPLEEATPGYYLLGLNIGGNVQVGNNLLDVYVSGTNLLNETYLDHMSLFRAFGVNQIGRNIALNVRIPF